MRIKFIYILGFILSFFFLKPSLTAQSKIAYVDFQYLISQLQAAQDIQTELERLSREWTAQLDAMRDTINNLENELESVSLALSKTGREMLAKNIAERKQKLIAFQEQKFSPVNGELYRRQQELLQPLMDKIRKAIDNVRIKQKYDVVFDISTGNPVSIDRRMDLTALVLEEFSVQGLTLKGQATQKQSGDEKKSERGDQNGTDKIQKR